MHAMDSSNTLDSARPPAAGNRRSPSGLSTNRALRHLVRRALYTRQAESAIDRQIREFAGVDLPLVDCGDGADRSQYVGFVADQLQMRFAPRPGGPAAAAAKKD